jgi:hypothetical protein
MAGGFNIVTLAEENAAAEAATGDGNALVKGEEDAKMVDMGDNAAAVGVDRRKSSWEEEGLEVRIQEANAAKWRGKHPCRDSLVPAASGYIWTKVRMKRHTSMNGSSIE